jgi:hypothetical protein
LAVRVFDQGDIYVFDNAGDTFTGTTATQGAYHRLRWVVDAAGVFTLFLDNVLIYTGAIIAFSSLSYLSLDCGTGPRVEGVITAYMGLMQVIQSELSTTGLLIPATAGQELHSGTKPIDLTKLFIVVNAGDPDADVELLGIGGA